MNKTLFYLPLLSLSWCMQGYIYQARVLKKGQPRQADWHYVIGLGDYHDKKHHATGHQREQIEALLAGTEQNAIKLITEDLSTQNAHGRFGWGSYYIDTRGGILGGLTQTAQNMGIDTENVEFRYGRVCALGPVLNHSHKQPRSLAPARTIQMCDLCNEINLELDTIKRFNDGPVLNAWYKKQTAAIEQKMANYGLRSAGGVSVADFVSCVQAKRVPLVKKLLTFDSGLLDMKMVHAVINAQDKKRVCAIAGGSHIERVSSVLQTVGYKPIFTAKPALQQAEHLRQCIGQEVKEYGFKPKPQAIDVSKVKQYF